MAQAEIQEALDLVSAMCTIGQIKSLLRLRRDEDGVRLSAENKDQLVARNLREALESGAISFDEVFDLIRSAEENGSQHIWYYKPKAGLADLFKADSTAERLWGPRWKHAIKDFPSVKLKPEGFLISDFRSSTRKPADWFLKVYGHSTITRQPAKSTNESMGFSGGSTCVFL